MRREWVLIDAADKTLGRLATEIARRHRVQAQPGLRRVDTGDYIVVVNAEKVAVTSNKAEQKTYWRHTGYPGGIRGVVFKDMIAGEHVHPEQVIEAAVAGHAAPQRPRPGGLQEAQVYVCRPGAPPRGATAATLRSLRSEL